MKLLFPSILVLVLLAPVPAAANNGRYQRGNLVYKEKLAECAMWWHRLGDITKSTGKRINEGDLAVELGKLPERDIRRWLANPMSVGPKVNCRPGTFSTERQVQDLMHYLKRRATNPVVKPVIKRQPLKRTTIRIMRTHAVARERLKVREEIRLMNEEAGQSPTPEKPVRGKDR